MALTFDVVDVESSALDMFRRPQLYTNGTNFNTIGCVIRHLGAKFKSNLGFGIKLKINEILIECTGNLVKLYIFELLSTRQIEWCHF